MVNIRNPRVTASDFHRLTDALTKGNFEEWDHRWNLVSSLANSTSSRLFNVLLPQSLWKVIRSDPDLQHIQGARTFVDFRDEMDVLAKDLPKEAELDVEEEHDPVVMGWLGQL